MMEKNQGGMYDSGEFRRDYGRYIHRGKVFERWFRAKFCFTNPKAVCAIAKATREYIGGLEADIRSLEADEGGNSFKEGICRISDWFERHRRSYMGTAQKGTSDHRGEDISREK